ncbi:MAG: M23 family metallopeptidase [Leptospiraceae bacterium]|nr:M23 family metallopeptidase [Leptospiraceae bacterium]MCP5496063.1 M23 family metallopeptidase [Leptospiraceae bacterium]
MNYSKIIPFIVFILSSNLCNSSQKFNSQKNHFSPLGDKLDFKRLIAAPFSFKTSSCLSDEHCGHNLFDSNKNTFWITESKIIDEWIIVDFGEKRLMNEIEIEFNSPCIREGYQVQVLKHWKWETIFQAPCYYKPKREKFHNLDASILRIYFPKKQEISYKIANIKIMLNGSILTGIQDRFTGYVFPVKGGILPDDSYSLPGSPRVYRNGIHKGIDVKEKRGINGEIIPLTKSDPVLAAAAGTIVRADITYKPVQATEYEEITSYNQKNPVTYVDRDFGGRQVWIDHGNGVMTSYNHLSSIPQNIQEGTKVKKGDVIGHVGNSGLKGEAYGTTEGIHLHLEIWIDGEYAGKDMEPNQVKKFLQYFFTE